MKKSLFSETKAQGSIEYLALIGGVILVAIIVGWALKQSANSVGRQGSDQASQTANR